MTALQAVIREWSLFAGASAFLAAMALAVALLVARRGARRLSSRSRYMLVAIALIVPVVGVFFIPVAAGAWDRLLGPRSAATQPAGALAADIDVSGIAVAAPVVDALSLLALLWGAGFVLIAIARLGEWVRWTRVARGAALCDDGRVIVAFNRAWRGKAATPTVRMSASCEEPMVVGLVDPVVLLPVGYGEGMTDLEIESVAVHELEHVVRRDNLDAALADLIASIFWFDPFHWIARGRLLELREGACDERVLASGLPPRAYLSALAKTSHAAITTPAVACMSGFRVRERMESIMSYPTHNAHWISEATVRAFALAVLGVLALAIAGFAPVIADESAVPGQHRLTIAMTPEKDGRILIEAEVRTPDGTLVSAPRIMALAGVPVEASTTTGGKQYKLSVTPAADGSGFAKLEVLNGGTVVDTVVKSIKAPLPPPPGYERVGGDIKAPTVLTRVNPIYPEAARKDRVQGLVIVQTLIGADGIVKDVKALQELPLGLTEAAVDAVRQWTFEPGTKDGAPVPVAFTLTINFKLDAGEKKEP